MIYYNQLVKQMKGFFADFSIKIGNDLGKVENKFLMNISYGIIKSQSTKLTDIARALKESINIKNIVDRLGKNLSNIQKFLPTMWDNYYKIIKPQIQNAKGLVFNIDLSDVIKPYSKKLEDLDRVPDGSDEHKIQNGYYVNEITATINNARILTVYSEIFSTLTKGFKSINTETFKALNKILEVFGNVGTCVMDRGYDSYEFFKYFTGNTWNFITRGKDNRSVIHKGEKINILALAERFKGRYTIKIQLKGKIHNAKCNFVKVKVRDIELTVVFVYFNNSVSIFYTNKNVEGKSTCLSIIYTYYMRWRIEEYFKFKKQQFDFEKFMVRSLDRINSLNAILSMALSAIDLMTKHRRGVLYSEIIKTSQSVKDEVVFEYYRIASGIKEILCHSTSGMQSWIYNSFLCGFTQLSLFDDFAET